MAMDDEAREELMGTVESAEATLEDVPASDVTASVVDVPVDPLVITTTVPAVDVAVVVDDPAPTIVPVSPPLEVAEMKVPDSERVVVSRVDEEDVGVAAGPLDGDPEPEGKTDVGRAEDEESCDKMGDVMEADVRRPSEESVDWRAEEVSDSPGAEEEAPSIDDEDVTAPLLEVGDREVIREVDDNVGTEAVAENVQPHLEGEKGDKRQHSCTHNLRLT